MGFFGSSKTKYRYHIVFSLACDSSSRVRDLKGDIELEGNETIEDAPNEIMARYIKENRIRGAYPTLVLEFNYR